MIYIVTFDPVKKIIEPVDSVGSGSIEINAIEIYSEWKAWTVNSSSAGYPPALRTVGGDPLSQFENLGSSFFIINGWRIKPNERSHRLVINGNIFTDPAGESITIPTFGLFNVTVEIFVSNLVQSSLPRFNESEMLRSMSGSINDAKRSSAIALALLAG